MREAVIVSTARTPLTKAHRGEFNITPGATLAAFAVKAAVERSGLDPALIEDAILGCGYPEGTTGRNIARQSIIRAGLPIAIAGTTVNRFCASGLQAIAMAAGRIVVDGAPAMIAGGVESISQIRTRSATDAGDSGIDPWIQEHKPALYMAMIETADIVAQRYGIGREAQDRFSAESQRKTEEAQLAGRYKEEIVACTTTMAVTDKETKAVTQREVTATEDNCNRRGTTYEALAKLQQHPGLFDRERLLAARTLYEFDDVFTAPLHGFAGADDYWTRASAKPRLHEIRIPALVLNARNDPFLPAQALPTAQDAGSHVTLWQPAHGGHVGFADGPLPGHLLSLPEAVLRWLRAH